MRLLNYLLEEGILPRDQVEYYLAYTTLVYELAETKPWDAVLSWDFRYRERQAQLNFPWGSRVTMMDLALIGGHKQGFPGPNQDPNPKPKPKKIICKNFSNNGWCNFGNECNYKHIPPRYPRPPRFDNRDGFNRRGAPPAEERPPATAPPPGWTWPYLGPAFWPSLM